MRHNNSVSVRQQTRDTYYTLTGQHAGPGPLHTHVLQLSEPQGPSQDVPAEALCVSSNDGLQQAISPVKFPQTVLHRVQHNSIDCSAIALQLWCLVNDKLL